ncbi:hypothetical protein BGZ81_006449 [Podila clonocystis]|nr:hypothetical protein BGZ81_006449 [Podila clonocystis]
MKFTAFSVLVLATVAFTASTANADMTCFQRCLHEGNTRRDCHNMCYDYECYRRCLKEGKDSYTCKVECT